MVVCHLIFVEVIFISPLLSCSFRCWFSNYYVYSSTRRLLNSFVMIVVILFFILYFRLSQFIFSCAGGIVMLLFWVYYVVLSRSWCSLVLFSCLLWILCNSLFLSNCFVPFSYRSAAEIFREFLLVSHFIPHLFATFKDRWFHSFVKEATKFYLLFFLILSPFLSWISGRDPLVV